MEIALLSQNSLRVKSKTAQIIVDADTKISKIPADAVLFSTKAAMVPEKVEGYRLIVQGPGEYEVGGIKISAFSLDNELSFSLDVDMVVTLIVSSSLFSKAKDKIKECHILVLKVTEIIPANIIEDFAPRVVLLYGEKAAEVAKEWGKEIQPIKKYSTTIDKLPSEREFGILE